MGFEKVFIIGFGEIGKTIANTLKINNFLGSIFATSRRKIYDCSFIDKTFDISDTNINYSNSIVFVCTPPNVVKETLNQIFSLTKEDNNCIISDVCSVKNDLLDCKNVNFISIHPMDGGHSSDIKYFFKRKILNYVIPNSKMKADKYKKFLNFLDKKLNCQNIEISTIEHDKIVAITSHLPNLILSSFYNDFSLINNVMWRSIFTINQINIKNAIENFTKLYEENSEKEISNIFTILLEENSINIRDGLKNPSMKKVLKLQYCDQNIFLSNLNKYFNDLIKKTYENSKIKM